MADVRAFPLADVLSVTTPYLLSQRRMAGVCELVEWMTFSAPTPDEIDLRQWSGLKLRTNVARRSLLRQHPWLATLCPATGLDEADLLAWLVEAERLHGSQLKVEQAEIEMREMCDAVAKMMQPMAEFMRKTFEEFSRVLVPLGQRFLDFGAALEAGMRADEKALAEHPDVAELDVRLDGFYGG